MRCATQARCHTSFRAIRLSHRLNLSEEATGEWQLLRRAPEQNCQRLFFGASQLILAAGIVGCVTGKAYAQTAPSAQPLAAPLVGQVPTKSPLSTTAVENRPRFGLVPSVRTVYDTNTLRFVDLNNSPRDNLRVTPGIDLDYNRLFGRVAVGISGSAGYDFNSRFKFLNQSRINFSGSARAPVGAVCSFNTTASYTRATFDVNDIQANATSNDVGAASTIQDYSVSAGCKRSAGFAQIAEVRYQSLDNSRTQILNVRRYEGNLGLSYSKPSIGTVSAIASYTHLSRPFVTELTGIDDDTNIYGFALGLRRAVSPRLRLDTSLGISKAVPQRNSVPRFVGASYSGQLEWLPTPRIALTGSVARQITNQNGISATYVIREDYTLSAGYKVSAKSQVTLTGTRIHRDFRGETLTRVVEPLSADRLTNLSANYSYDITPRLRIGLGMSHRWRNADNPVYNYKSTVLSSSIGAHF